MKALIMLSLTVLLLTGCRSPTIIVIGPGKAGVLILGGGELGELSAEVKAADELNNSMLKK